MGEIEQLDLRPEARRKLLCDNAIELLKLPETPDRAGATQTAEEAR